MRVVASWPLHVIRSLLLIDEGKKQASKAAPKPLRVPGFRVCSCVCVCVQVTLAKSGDHPTPARVGTILMLFIVVNFLEMILKYYIFFLSATMYPYNLDRRIASFITLPSLMQ